MTDSNDIPLTYTVGDPITRRFYMVAQSVMRGSGVVLAIEAVSSTAIEHPEWDMDETKTWDEWKAELG